MKIRGLELIKIRVFQNLVIGNSDYDADSDDMIQFDALLRDHIILVEFQPTQSNNSLRFFITRETKILVPEQLGSRLKPTYHP